MPSERVNALISKLSRGLEKSRSIFGSLSPDQWDAPISDDPDAWSMRILLAHFISSEAQLLEIAQDIAAGGQGAPEHVDVDAFNADEMQRMKTRTLDQLLRLFDETRTATIEWLRGLGDEDLDLTGGHPTLGIVNVETVIFSSYAHQLLHMREVVPRIRSRSSDA